MTQTREPSPPLEETGEDVEDYVLTLSSQAHALESVVIDFATLGAESAMRLREFQQLTSLRLRDFQLFGQPEGKPRMHSVGLPPNLEVLEYLDPVVDDEEILELMCYMIENKSIMARKWTKLIVPGGESGLPEKLREACAAAELQVESP